MAVQMKKITKLEPNQIFVFGSNLAGIHGAGAAYQASRSFGAVYGVGIGFTGQCYAIPTKDRNLKTLPLERIKDFVTVFLARARNHPELEFLVTPIGCGLAGYDPKQIAPFFEGAPKNVCLPQEFKS
jgi:hypothetical protein